ncbi:MAG: alkaline phosphatase [Acidimicrobiales bacterium]
MAVGSNGLSRRAFLAATVAAAAAACSDGADTSAPATAAPAATTRPDPTAAPDPTTTPPPSPTPEAAPIELAGDPFSLGVASGDPTDTSVILWTRLAPDPMAGGGMPDVAVPVRWEVGTDDTFAEVVASGTERAVPGLAHSVHVDASGLQPDSWYMYRFSVGEYDSPVGRTRTLPPPDSSPADLTLAFSSCQNYEAGFYAAHRHLAAEQADLFVWLGDYIYEYGPGQFPVEGPTGDVRVHNSPEVTDLAAYRNRYALYKGDVDLQAHHAARPWIITWDDHEVDNDHAGDVSENDDDPEVFSERRAAAYQAWYEHLPVRLDPPEGSSYRIHRNFNWGDLADVFVLDGRQYRDDQPTDGTFIPLPGLEDESLPLRTLSPTALDPEHTFLGREQETWLIDGVGASSAIWKVLAQQVMMHGLSVLPGQDPPLVATDTWDGYYGNRKRILEAFAAAGVEDLVVLTGDFHAASVGDLKPDPFDSTSPVVGTEFMATSISSSFPEAAADAAPLILAFNPHIRFFDPRKGYTICSVRRDEWVAVYKALDDPTNPESAIATIATFTVASGTPGAQGP